MDVLVRMDVRLPDDMDPDRRRQLLADERAVGEALVDEGVLHALWRLPGRLANVGVWRVADPEQLHHALSRLPLLPWAEVDIDLLAAHPLATPGAAGGEATA